MSIEDASPEKENKTSAVHDEYAGTPVNDDTSLDKEKVVHDESVGDDALEILSAEVKYDNGQLRDLMRSPYVFGAAWLASIGGFSFGYGTCQSGDHRDD